MEIETIHNSLLATQFRPGVKSWRQEERRA